MKEWIANAVGAMHVHKISQVELAKHLGIRNDYLNSILAGRRSPKGAEERILTAIDEIIASRR